MCYSSDSIYYVYSVCHRDSCWQCNTIYYEMLTVMCICIQNYYTIRSEWNTPSIRHKHTHSHTYGDTFEYTRVCIVLVFQEFCRRSLIPHVVVLSDKELFFERKQVKMRTLETNGKTTERILGVAELVEFLQPKQGIDRSDSIETQTSTRLGGGPSNLDSFPSNSKPPVNVTILATTKLSGHFKRKIHDVVS